MTFALRAPIWLAGLMAAPLAHAQAATADATARSYVLDASSSLVVRTYKDGARATLTHDHVARATEIVGEASYDPAHPEALKLKVVVQAKSLVVDEMTERARFGLSDTLSDKDKKAVDDALKGRDTLDVRRFPTISFRSTRAARADAGALMVFGDFTLHGVTRAVSLPVTIKAEPDGRMLGEGRLTIKTSDFGIRPYSAFLGALKVKDEVDIHITLVGVPK